MWIPIPRNDIETRFFGYDCSIYVDTQGGYYTFSIRKTNSTICQGRLVNNIEIAKRIVEEIAEVLASQ